MISSTLDRPFSISDEDVACLVPETVFTDGEGSHLPVVTFRCAQLLRVIRSQPASGATFHLANFEYWKEAATISLSELSGSSKELVELQLERMTSELLSSIVSVLHYAGKVDELQHVASTLHVEHTDYLNKLQRRVHLQDYEIFWLDAVDVFAMGVCICFLSCLGSLPSTNRVAVFGPTRICIELLTLAAERFPDVRTLRDLLNAFVDCALANNGDFLGALESALLHAVNNSAILPKRDHQLIRTALSFLLHDRPSFTSSSTM